MSYRKPTIFLPPEQYCDRWCERCTLDPARCDLVGQLFPHGRPDGGPPIRWRWAEVSSRARRLLRGVDRVSKITERDDVPPPSDLLLASARLYVYGILDLMEDGPAVVLRLGRRHASVAGMTRSAIGVWSKLCRACGSDDPASMDAILSAQVAHQLLIESLAGLCRLFEKQVDPQQIGGLIYLGLKLSRQIDRRWLRTPHPQLVPAREAGDRWGPLQAAKIDGPAVASHALVMRH